MSNESPKPQDSKNNPAQRMLRGMQLSNLNGFCMLIHPSAMDKSKLEFSTANNGVNPLVVIDTLARAIAQQAAMLGGPPPTPQQRGFLKK